MSKNVNPYSNLPDHCFWSRSHRDKTMSEIDPVVKDHFKLNPRMKIATAGSCFAQHIARHLQSNGYNYFVSEKAHPIISPKVSKTYNYGVFTARFGNLYTVRQLLQLAQRARGLFEPKEDVWAKDGRYYDAFRPNIQPGGFTYLDSLYKDREVHLAAVRKMLDEADVFVFTFGLTEAWRSKQDGAVYPLAPGVVAGDYKSGKHEFVNFTVSEIVEDFKIFVALLRENNPKVKIIMTVSPVPLKATARKDQSVISATSYSKAVLRVAVEELTQTVKDAFYFPSYEVITGNYNRGAYYGSNFRDIEEAGISHVMTLFMKHYTNAKDVNKNKLAKLKTNVNDFQTNVEKALDIICDEELLEKD